MSGGQAAVIAEMDGGIVPTVECDAEALDKRKGKVLQWKEAKICLAHRYGSTDIAFGGTFSGGVEAAGREFSHCAVAAGFRQALFQNHKFVRFSSRLTPIFRRISKAVHRYR
jgi:hypothetical protein